MKELPIGVFDSGVGGLTVLNELVKVLPDENYIYVGDLKNSPYGEKSPEFIYETAKKIISYLENEGVKYIVVACNTASSHVIEKIRYEIDTPIYTVIEGAVEGVNESHNNVLLAATTATVNAGMYDLKLKEKNEKINLLKQACKDIVPQIEKGCQSDEENQKTVDKYMKKYNDLDLDLLILGCTHYPIWKNYFEKSLGNKVEVFDPAKSLAEYVKKDLCKMDNLSNEGGRINAYVTKNLDSFIENSESIIKGYSFDEIKEINLS